MAAMPPMHTQDSLLFFFILWWGNMGISIQYLSIQHNNISLIIENQGQICKDNHYCVSLLDPIYARLGGMKQRIMDW